MCRDCGCSLGPSAARAPFAAHPAPHGHVESVEVITAILDANDRVAAHNRAHFDAQGVLAINLMSSPGSGKTSLLEATIRALEGEFKVAVIEGDLATVWLTLRLDPGTPGERDGTELLTLHRVAGVWRITHVAPAERPGVS